MYSRDTGRGNSREGGGGGGGGASPPACPSRCGAPAPLAAMRSRRLDASARAARSAPSCPARTPRLSAAPLVLSGHAASLTPY